MMSGVGEPSDEELLLSARCSAEAFGAFYDRHHLPVLAALRLRVSSSEVALDLAAEVFAAALERCDSFSSRGAGSARAWLYAIARNKLIDLHRTGVAADRARRALQMRPLVVTDEQLVELEQRLDAASTGALQALAELPSDERDAVAARVVGEADYAQIARDHAVSESVIRKRVSRGLRRMRATLEENS
jgi:RNA polymerase sigma factor (sigma-70 family)